MVCGHIHRAEMREISNTLYCNDGDWVESRTALVEHFDGPAGAGALGARAAGAARWRAGGGAMKIALVTDAWQPQVNGVVTTLVGLVRELGAAGHRCILDPPRPVPHAPLSGLRRHRPGQYGPGRQMARQLDALQPQAVHIATEGPLGWAARAHVPPARLALHHRLSHQVPRDVHAALKVPLSWGYALFRHFHKPSAGVMVPRACCACCRPAVSQPARLDARRGHHAVPDAAPAAGVRAHGPAATPGGAVRGPGFV